MLRAAYATDLLVMGFRWDAIAGVPDALSVNAAIGLEKAVVILIFQRKTGRFSHQYDVKRLVPALTRCVRGLIVMWHEEAYECIPWKQLPTSDGTVEVLEILCKKNGLVPDSLEVVHWFCWTPRVQAFRTGRDEDLLARAELYVQQHEELSALEQGIRNLADQSDSAVEMEVDGEVATDLDVDPMAVRADAGPVLNSPPAPPQYCEAASSLADFVATCISHMVVETRGKLYFATPANRVLQKVCYRDLQHLEEGGDQGNAPYGIVYDLWIEVMNSCHADIAIPRNASKKGSSPAGNIIESYKMIAEQVLLHDPQNVSPRTQDCIRAALIHLG